MHTKKNKRPDNSSAGWLVGFCDSSLLWNIMRINTILTKIYIFSRDIPLNPFEIEFTVSDH